MEELIDLFTRSLARVQIDLNSRTPEGYSRARLSRASRDVTVGETVIAYESDDEVAAMAIVADVDRHYGFIYLDIDWSTLRDDVPMVLHPTVRMASPTLSILETKAAPTIRVRGCLSFGSTVGTIASRVADVLHNSTDAAGRLVAS